MRTSGRFRAETAYEKSTDRKANMNTPIMAVVTQVGGVVAVPNRANYYWIILVNDPNRQTICYSSTGVVLSNGDVIYVAKARDRDLSHYEFVAFVADAGGGVIPPTCPKWAQVVTVSMNACQFATLGAAITFITVTLPVAMRPAAGRLFLIQMMAGNYNEAAAAADVVVPSHCTVIGRGEATEIELGAFTIQMSADSSLQNVVVESSDPAEAVRANGVDNVVLRNVKAIQATTADCFHIYGGSTNVYLYDCVADVPAGAVGFHISGAASLTGLHTCTAMATGVYNAATYGFHVGGTASVEMDYCCADHANFADALRLDDDALACTTRWCTFLACDEDVHILGANPNWFHLSCDFDPDNSTIVAGTHFADPTKRFNQTVIVAEFGGDFQLLSEATAWVIGQADHTADKLYTILMLGGNFTEAGNVTIPTFTHVVGMNDGTEIELGAFSIIMSNDSGLFNVKVESSDLSHAIDCNGVTGVWLRHVYVVTTSTGGCLYVHGASDVQVHDCVFEVTLNTWSVYVTDSATLLLDHCIVEGGAGVGGYGLFLIGTSTVTAKWCEFEGYVPIYIGATATFNHIACQFDPNFTPAGAQWIAGRHHALPTKRFNQTVIVAEEGGDFQALSEAVKWINNLADAAAGNLYGVLMLAGNFAEAASVIIPSYVSVMGQGEGTEIEMAATHTLTLSSDSSLQNVIVEGNTDAAEGVVQIASSASNVVLRNVISIQSNGAGYCYYADGDAYLIWFYECRAEGSAGADGFVFEEASAVLDDCEANHANLANGLLLLHASDVIITRYCAFAGTVDAVNTLAGSSWSHLACNVDAGNVTLGGTVIALPITPVNLDGWADALILDADGDTTISAPTDDQIDIEIAGTDYGELTERVHQWDEVYSVGTWYDYELVSAAEGDHFRQNAGTPTGWVQIDAAVGSLTNARYSFWELTGTPGDVSYDYRKQSGIDIEALAANNWASFQFGPILFRDAGYVADVDYYFSIHGETAGVIDLTEYVRVHLQWNSAGGVWRVQGESDQGAGQTASGWTTLDAAPLHMPLFFRIVIRNNANKQTREYFGSTHWPLTQTMLQDVNETTTWGQVYWRIHQTRGAGHNDILDVGAVDYFLSA